MTKRPIKRATVKNVTSRALAEHYFNRHEVEDEELDEGYRRAMASDEHYDDDEPESEDEPDEEEDDEPEEEDI